MDTITIFVHPHQCAYRGMLIPTETQILCVPIRNWRNHLTECIALFILMSNGTKFRSVLIQGVNSHQYAQSLVPKCLAT